MSSENFYKILLLGDGKVGKSSLFTKYLLGEFNDKYNENKAFQNQKIVTSLNGETIKIQLYDPPENVDKYKLYTSIYLKINCIIVLFDITNKNSFENVFNKWIPHFFNNKQNINSKSIPVIVLGNFKDKDSNKAVLEEDIKTKIKEVKKYTNKCKYKEISVKNDDISALFKIILNFIFKNGESFDDNKNYNEQKENIKSIDKSMLNKAKNKMNTKVIFLGDAKVGKTSIINRYVDNEFSDEYIQTVSDDNRAKDIFFSSEQIHELFKGVEKEEILKKMPKELYEEDAVIQMDIWDNPGQEDVHNFNRNYYKHATCCILVFDLCDRVTFEQVINWRNNFLQYLKIISIPNEYETKYYDIIDEIPFILVGNKTDSEERDITAEEIEEFMEENKKEIKCYNEISVKENLGLEELFENISKYSFEFKVNEMYGNKADNDNKSYNINNENNIEENELKSNNNDNDEEEYDIFGRSKKEILKAEQEEKERKERELRELLEQEEKERKEKQEKEKEEREERERIEKDERERKEKEERERKVREEKERIQKEEKEKEELEILSKLEQEENERIERDENERKEREEKIKMEKEEEERKEKEEKEKKEEEENQEKEEKEKLDKDKREEKEEENQEKEEKEKLDKDKREEEEEENQEKEKLNKDKREEKEEEKQEKEEKEKLDKDKREKKEEEKQERKKKKKSRKKKKKKN